METATMEQEVLDKWMAEVERAKNGEVNALDVGTKLYELKESLNELYDEMKDHIFEERDKYSHKEDVIRNGYRVSNITASYPQYKEDDEYVMLDQKATNRKNLIKRATQKGKTITDTETGETVSPVSVKVRSYPKLEFVGQGLS